MKRKPFYVQRSVNGEVIDLLVDDWHFRAWTGCFCLINDKGAWS